MSNAAFHFGGESRLRGLLAALAVAVVALCGAVSAAFAEPAHPNYVLSGSFASEGELPSELSSPKRIAVDPATGNILITDANRVVVFAPELAPSAAYLTEFGIGTLSEPFGIAVDRSTDEVYVADAGHNRILRFKSNGAAVPVYTVDPAFKSPALGTGVGQVGSFAAPLAVDPQTHDLLVADHGDRRVSRYNSSGVFLGSFDGATTPGGAFRFLYDIAVGPSGIIYVSDHEGDLGSFINGGATRLERFEADGTPLGQIELFRQVAAVGVNGDSGLVVVGNEDNLGPTNLKSYIGGDAAGETVTGHEGVLNGVAFAPGENGRMYTLDSKFVLGSSGVDVFTPVLAPGAALSAPAEVTSTSMRLDGTLDPGGPETTSHFEFSADGGATWTARTEQAVVSGTGESAIHEDLTGLAPNTVYKLRLVATNSETSTTTKTLTVPTAAAPPAITPRPVNDRTLSSVVLNAQINPYGRLTTYHYEYGESAAYGQRLPLRHEAVAGTGHVPVPLTVLLSGLAPGSTYHYRVVAQSSAGVTYGEDATFTTPASGEGPPVRVYEQVTPVDKGGAVLSSTAKLRITEDGDGIGYNEKNAVNGPVTEGSPIQAYYSSLPGSGGWDQFGYNVPELPTESGFNSLDVMGISRDLTHEVVISDEKLADGAVEGAGNIYRRDVVTGQAELIEVDTHLFLEEVRKSRAVVVAGTSDYSKVLLTDEHGVEEWSSGTLTPVIVMPDGSPGETAERFRTTMEVSDDISRVGFTLLGSGPGVGVYVRDGGHTTAISVSHRSGDDPTAVQPGSLTTATRDGRYYFFTSEAQLTENAPEGPSAYRYDIETGALRYLAYGLNPIAASSDGESVLLQGFGTLSLLREGHLKTIEESEAYFPEGMSLSPSGRYATFRTYVKETSYNNFNSVECAGTATEVLGGHCSEIYVYDGESEALDCASCPADGAVSTGGAFFPGDEDEHGQPVNVNDLGEVYFNTPTSLVPQDSNGVDDTYEYKDGETHLISPGTRAFVARPGGASVDGRDVYFITEQQLVAQDTDTEPDIYDARIGGGIPSQNQDHTPPPECETGQCPAALGGEGATAPTIASIEFAGLVGPGATATRAATKLKVSKKVVSGSAFTVNVTVPGKGHLVGTGSGVRRVQKSVAKAGAYKLRFALTAAERRKLAREKLSVKVRVSFAPSSGTSSSAVVSVLLKKSVSAKRTARTGGRAGR